MEKKRYMNREEAKKFVKATILSGDSERIKKVLNRYWVKFEKKKIKTAAVMNQFKEVFGD